MPSYAKDTTVRLSLDPSQYEGPLYWCDDNISGFVLLTIDSLFYTRSITVSLEAHQTVQVRAKNADGQNHDSSELYVSLTARTDLSTQFTSLPNYP